MLTVYVHQEAGFIPMSYVHTNKIHSHFMEPFSFKRAFTEHPQNLK